ncbi:MAG: vWA domain-containing protein [Dokdonia sp.]
MKTPFRLLFLSALLILVPLTQATALSSNDLVPAFAKSKTTAQLVLHDLLPNTDHTTIRVALLLDTSNSMDGLIDQAKAQLWELVNELSYARCGNEQKPALAIALYEYGNDGLNAREGYIRQVLPLSSDLDEISKQLFALRTNGGNEYCGQVIQTAINQLDWGVQQQDLNLIFIAGNEPFTQGPIRYQDAAANACEKDISINTIFCGNYNEGVHTSWKDGAQRTKGDYIAINSDKQTVHIPSPYDQEILKKNKELNTTYIAYGSLGRSKIQEQEVQDDNAQSYGNANAVKRAVSKSSHFYKNEKWDLVDAEASGVVDYNSLSQDQLPTALQGKTAAEIKAYVDKQRDKRERIQEEIAALNKKRRLYVSEQAKAPDNQLRSALLVAIKKQASKKSFTWD